MKNMFLYRKKTSILSEKSSYEGKYSIITIAQSAYPYYEKSIFKKRLPISLSKPSPLG